MLDHTVNTLRISTGDFAVRTGTNAKIVTKLPVIQIMPTLLAGLSIS
jgi:hypothetical protein